jgi:hypothetical protein
MQFATDKTALDFIAGRIAAEAERAGTPLTEIERKMLYFSQTDWTLPDMAEVSEEFDRDYDQDEYERKIGDLARKITAHHHGDNREEKESWDAAREKLSEGDHYILVLVSSGRSNAAGFLPALTPNPVRPPHDILKLWLTAIAIVFGLLGLALLCARLSGR